MFTSLIGVTTTLLLSASIFAFLPENENSRAFEPGELFLSPLASDYKNGFEISIEGSTSKLYPNNGILSLDLAKSFSIRRWYFSDNMILEIGGVAGFKSFFSLGEENEPSMALGYDYLVGNHIGFLINTFVVKFNWNYVQRESTRGFVDYINGQRANGIRTRNRNLAHPHVYAGDQIELLVADVRANVRSYAAFGYHPNLNLPGRRSFFRYGLDFRTAQQGKRPRLILGAEHSITEINNWSSTYKVAIGMEKSETPLLGWRILATFQEGNYNFGPYYDLSERSILSGISASFVF